jgi:hypothetical protein
LKGRDDFSEIYREGKLILELMQRETADVMTSGHMP